MKTKKILLVLAAVLLMLSMTATASAAGQSFSTKITALCKLPEIRVTVPASGTVFINPTKAKISMSATVDPGSEEEFTEAQIVSTPTAIKNESEVPVKVNVTVTGHVKNSGLSLSQSSLADSEVTAKKAFIYFEIKSASDTENIPWDSEFNADEHLVLVNNRAVSKNEIVTLDANGENDCYGAFRLAGDCTSNPKSPWKTTDGVNVEVAFTFTPMRSTD